MMSQPMTNLTFAAYLSRHCHYIIGKEAINTVPAYRSASARRYAAKLSRFGFYVMRHTVILGEL
jgi:hypothetical protein